MLYWIIMAFYFIPHRDNPLLKPINLGPNKCSQSCHLCMAITIKWKMFPSILLFYCGTLGYERLSTWTNTLTKGFSGTKTIRLRTASQATNTQPSEHTTQRTDNFKFKLTFYPISFSSFFCFYASINFVIEYPTLS